MTAPRELPTADASAAEPATQAAGAAASPPSRRLPWPAIVAAICLLASLAAWRAAAVHEERVRTARFDTAAKALLADFGSRLRRCEQLLLTAAAWAEHAPTNDPRQWAALGVRMGHGSEDWCLDTLSWYPRVRHAERAAFIARQRAGGMPGYDIRPPGARATHYPIAMVTPDTEASRRFLGLDPWADARRRPLLEAAAAERSVRLSGIESFAPGTRALLRYAAVGPLDAQGLPSGFIGAPLRLDLLLSAIVGAAPRVAMKVSDLGDGPGALEAVSAPGAEAPARGGLAVEQVVEHGGRRLRVQVQALAGWIDEEPYRLSTWVLACGLVLGLLACWLTAVLVRSESRARDLALEYSRVARHESAVARHSEAVRRMLIEAVPVGVVHVGPDSRVVEANRMAHELLGYPLGSLTGVHLSAMHDAREVERRCAERAAELGRPVVPGRELFEQRVDEHGKRIEQEWTMLRRDGSAFTAAVDAVAMELPGGGELGSVRVFSDVSARKRQLEDIRHQARHDPLTGLGNRAQVDEWVRAELARAARRGDRFALMLIDLDRFKQINDSFGHETGDQVLLEVGRRLRAGLRPADAVARLGGDEFVVMLASPTNRDEAVRIAERLLTAFAAEMQLPAQRLHVTPSVGVAVYPDHGLQLAELLRAADQAMYRAKRVGRNAVSLAEPITGDGSDTAN